MRLPRDRSIAITAAIVAILIALLPVLLVFQYRWIDEASRASTARMRESMGMRLSQARDAARVVCRLVKLRAGQGHREGDTDNGNRRTRERLRFQDP